jgi:hypothetical protein
MSMYGTVGRIKCDLATEPLPGATSIDVGLLSMFQTTAAPYAMRYSKAVNEPKLLERLAQVVPAGGIMMTRFGHAVLFSGHETLPKLQQIADDMDVSLSTRVEGRPVRKQKEMEQRSFVEVSRVDGANMRPNEAIAVLTAALPGMEMRKFINSAPTVSKAVFLVAGVVDADNEYYEWTISGREASAPQRRPGDSAGRGN